MKISGCILLATSDLFLLKKYQDFITLSPDITMKGIIIGNPGRYSPYWSTSCNDNYSLFEIDTKYLCTKVMKCNKITKELLIIARRKSINFYHSQKPK